MRTRGRRSGVVYAEQLLMLIIGSCVAALLMAFAAHRLQPRYARIARVLYSNAPEQ
ncbi:MAG TPA: hypothetical protein VJR89_21280 [Polyangiales bacterium]|nr:hypothetical protein [Polyangiales bacterium]